MRAAEWRARAAWTMGAGPGKSAETDSDEEDAEERARRRRDRAPGSTPSHAGPDIGALTLDDVVGPPPGALDPSGFEFSPDDEHVAYLHAHLPHDPASAWTAWTLLVLDVSSGTRHACFDPTSTYGAGGATATDVLRERQSGMGVSRYEWAREAKNPSRLLVPRPEGAYVVDVEKIFSPRGDDERPDAKSPRAKPSQSQFRATTRVSPPRCVARASRDAPVLDASVSPDGRWVAFVRRSEIHIAPCDAAEDQNAAQTLQTRPLEARATHGARGRPFVTHGLAEFVAAEEMGRDRGFWWRPDSGALAFTRVDSSRVETVDVTRGYALGAGGEALGAGDAAGDAAARDREPRDRDDATRAKARRHDAEAKPRLSDEKHSYPHAGRENARVTLGVVDVSSLTLERNAARRDATLRRASDPEVPDPELFPVTWMDVDCGSSASARGEREEYLASVAWTPTLSPRERRERASDESAESAESASRGFTPNARDANVSRKRFSFLRGFPNASSRRTLATSDDDASSEMSRHALLVRVQNRAQTQIASIFIDAATGERATLARDASSMLERVDDDADAWVNITQNPIVLKKGDPTGGDHAAPGDAVVVSERDGYAHVYLAPVGENRGPPIQLTAGAWCVHRVHAVDEDRGWVYFTANERGPLERHLYRARLWPSTAKATAKEARLEVAPPTRLTRAAGCHTVSLDHAFARFVDVREDLRTPPVAVMRAIPRSSEDDDVSRETDEEDDRTQRPQESQTPQRPLKKGSHDEPGDVRASTFARVDAALRATVATYAATYASYKAPSLVRVPAADGVATLYGALYLPDKETFGNGPFPCVVAVYGGPGAQCVVDAWRLTADARAQRLRGRGVATLKLDNRGTANRGRAFERAIRSNGAVLGDVEVADQVAGVRFLVEKRIVDPKRVAIVGWSYGGFVAAAALLRAPETFACAVAGAPVTSWLAYNAHYSERYLGAPGAAGGASRYRRCDLLTFVRERARRDPRGWFASLKPGKKKMLLAHGASDENVHLSHTARLADALAALDAAAARRGSTETETETEEDDRRRDGTRARSREGVSSSFDVAVFARERHVPRGRVARREFEERVDAFLADAFE